jgi:cytochrome P450
MLDGVATERRATRVIDGRFVPPRVTPPSAPLPFARAVAKLLDNPIEAWPQAVYEERYWRPRSLGVPGWRYLYVLDPDAIRDVLLEKQQDFSKGVVFRRMLRPALGEAILTAEGAQWRWQRQAAAPAFRHDRLLAMTPSMARAAEATLARWRAGAPGACHDISRDMVRTTFDVILETMLSGGEGLDIERTSREIGAYLETLGRPSLADLLGLPAWLRVASKPRGARALRYLQRAVADVVKQRRAEGSARIDLVSMLLRAVDPETGRQMSDEDLRDNIMTFISAGHETTALALTWALYLVSNHRATEERLLEEVNAVAGNAPIGPEHIERLAFTRQVVQEAMRLFPPVAVLPRAAERDAMIADLRVEAGTTLLIPIYALHRHRALWTDADVFDPDRFAPDKVAARHRFAYLPFGGGPRICIGMSFAMIESTAMLATFVRGARFVHDPNHQIRPLVRITLRPEGGMPMRVTMRANG